MNIVPYYKHYNRNVGRIKSIEEGFLTVSVNAGHGGGDLKLPFESCYRFKPKIDDRVLLCVDEDGEVVGHILKKLGKRRQDA
jgi:hypothetical protein